MAANALLQPTVSEHKLLKIDVKRGDAHTNYFTAHCSCGWKMSAGVVKQHFAEGSWTTHMEAARTEMEKAECAAKLAQAMEDLIKVVTDCERIASDEDRIDAAVRYSR